MTTTVLIADDNQNVREAWQRLLLTIPNIEVVAMACDGEEAVSLALQHRPSVVLMDLSMPHVDGFEATRRIRDHAPEVRVIIVTAHTSASCVEKGFEVGADGYVAKMAAANELPQAIRAVAQGRRFRTALAARDPEHVAPDVEFSQRRSSPVNRALTLTEYRLLVQHSPVMIWRSGRDASCDYFNETWLAFTGRSLQEEMGDGWAEGVHQDDLERCLSHYRDHFSRRAAFDMEYRLRRYDGVYRRIFDRGVPFTDDTGAFAGFIGSCVDVDDRSQAQAEPKPSRSR